MGILNDTITPAVPAPLTEKDEKRDIFGRKKMTYFKRKKELRCEQGSNLCGNIPLDFESNALTTRPSQQVFKRGSRCRMNLSFVHKVVSISGWFTSANWKNKKISSWLKVYWGYSSVVEHSTADREVPSSNLGAPWSIFWNWEQLVSNSEFQGKVWAGMDMGV